MLEAIEEDSLKEEYFLKYIKIIEIESRVSVAKLGERRVIQLLSDYLKEDVLDICKGIAGSRKAVAACTFGPWACGYADAKSDVHVLLLISSYREVLRYHVESLEEFDVSTLAVDRGIFERDVRQGLLGEFVAEKVTFPYEPLINKEYLRRQEVKVKRRIVWELFDNLVLEFPELSQELLIKAEYFMYETIRRRAKLFPPITYSFLNMFREDLLRRNIDVIMRGYLKAIDQLAEEKWITFSDGYIKATQSLINTIRSQKIRIPPFVKSIQRTALLHILNVFPRITNLLIQDQKTYRKSHRKVEAEQLVFRLENPEKYLLMPTPHGLVPLSDRTTIEVFAEKIISNKAVSDINIEEMGGVLNTVYLLTFRENSKEQRVTVKKFEDWFGFKWFPLALWALGTKTFAVLGRSRLEREYAINQFLHNHGFTVPKILHVSHKERLIFKEFIEGESLVGMIKQIISSEEKTPELALIRQVGRKIAEVHKLGVSLGDCKPENIIITREGRPCFVDLEQASRDGNQAWDIAEFLYYSGHYASPISPADSAELITTEFIEGYLEAGGKKETVKKAGSPRYTKVFTVFTPPHVILAISNTCKKTGG